MMTVHENDDGKDCRSDDSGDYKNRRSDDRLNGDDDKDCRSDDRPNGDDGLLAEVGSR